MKAKVARDLTTALRSGEYEKGVGYLVKKVNYLDLDKDEAELQRLEYCCLGVLCELARKDGLKLDLKFLENGIGEYLSDHLYSGVRIPNATHLPREVAEWAGTRDGTTNPRFTSVRDSQDLTVGLTEVNDHPLTFDQIADLIDAFYEEL